MRTAVYNVPSVIRGTNALMAEAPCMLQPDYKEFSRLAGEATLVPVVKSVTADLLTPVSAFLAVAEDEPHCFLLESVERGEQIGRYTFLGARPYMQVCARGNQVTLERGSRREQRSGNVFKTLKELLRAHRAAHLPGLPPFTAGGGGCFSHHPGRRVGKKREPPKKEFFGFGCMWMFFFRPLAFVHFLPPLHNLSTPP